MARLAYFRNNWGGKKHVHTFYRGWVGPRIKPLFAEHKKKQAKIRYFERIFYDIFDFLFFAIDQQILNPQKLLKIRHCVYVSFSVGFATSAMDFGPQT